MNTECESIDHMENSPATTPYRCSNCGRHICGDCLHECSNCPHPLCGECVCECDWCSTTLCLDCVQCDDEGMAYCPACWEENN